MLKERKESLSLPKTSSLSFSLFLSNTLTFPALSSPTMRILISFPLHNSAMRPHKALITPPILLSFLSFFSLVETKQTISLYVNFVLLTWLSFLFFLVHDGLFFLSLFLSSVDSNTSGIPSQRHFKSFASGHKDIIHDVSYDFYGRRLATCSSDQLIHIYDQDEAGDWKLSSTLPQVFLALILFFLFGFSSLLIFMFQNHNSSILKVWSLLFATFLYLLASSSSIHFLILFLLLSFVYFRLTGPIQNVDKSSLRVHLTAESLCGKKNKVSLPLFFFTLSFFSLSLFSHSLFFLTLFFFALLSITISTCSLCAGENTWKCVWTNIDARDAVYDVKFAPHHLGLKVREKEREREKEEKRRGRKLFEKLETFFSFFFSPSPSSRFQFASCSGDGFIRIYEAPDVMNLSNWNMVYLSLSLFLSFFLVVQFVCVRFH